MGLFRSKKKLNFSLGNALAGFPGGKIQTKADKLKVANRDPDNFFASSSEDSD